MEERDGVVGEVEVEEVEVVEVVEVDVGTVVDGGSKPVESVVEGACEVWGGISEGEEDEGRGELLDEEVGVFDLSGKGDEEPEEDELFLSEAVSGETGWLGKDIGEVEDVVMGADGGVHGFQDKEAGVLGWRTCPNEGAGNGEDGGDGEGGGEGEGEALPYSCCPLCRYSFSWG